MKCSVTQELIIQHSISMEHNGIPKDMDIVQNKIPYITEMIENHPGLL